MQLCCEHIVLGLAGAGEGQQWSKAIVVCRVSEITSQVNSSQVSVACVPKKAASPARGGGLCQCCCHRLVHCPVHGQRLPWSLLPKQTGNQTFCPEKTARTKTSSFMCSHQRRQVLASVSMAHLRASTTRPRRPAHTIAHGSCTWSEAAGAPIWRRAVCAAIRTGAPRVLGKISRTRKGRVF